MNPVTTGQTPLHTHTTSQQQEAPNKPSTLLTDLSPLALSKISEYAGLDALTLRTTCRTMSSPLYTRHLTLNVTGEMLTDWIDNNKRLESGKLTEPGPTLMQRVNAQGQAWLERKNLKFSNVDTVQLQTMIESKSLGAARQLHFNHCQITYQPERAVNSGFASLHQLKKLEKLVINSAHLDEKASSQRIPTFISEGIEQLSALTSLTLSRANLHDQQLANLGQLTQLKELHLPYNAVSGRGFASFKENTPLTSLTLDYCSEFSDEGFLLLERFQQLQRLSATDCTMLSSEGMRVIPKLTQLETLLLKNCLTLNDEAMHTIASQRKLAEVDISHCAQVTDIGFGHIAHLPRLKHLMRKPASALPMTD